jgi:outer membrane receptor protein involved in Fe transport
MKSFLQLKRIFLLLFLLTGFYFNSVAQAIKGKVFDNKTGEPLTGATVQIERGSFKQSQSARLDGSYFFNDLQYGTYKVKVNYIGYQDSKSYELTVSDSNPTVTQNITLQDLSTDLSEVSITGTGSKVSDRSARNLEKVSSSVVNILSQNAIQLLPDVTVGNTMQRISGVTIQRTSSGEGRYAIIRGMDQRYNNTLVNGIKIPSPDDKYRFVPLDIFPSELLERLEVIKALTPSMEGDAIGGTMNLVMKSAPERFVLYANTSGGLSTLFSSSRPFTSFSSSGINGMSPAQINGNDYVARYSDFNNSAITSNKNHSSPFNTTAGLTIGNRFLNNKLGVIVSGSYQNIYRGADSKELTPNAQPTAIPAPNSPSFSDSYERFYSTQTQRFGLNGKVDYVFNKKNKISFYNLYVRSNEYISRLTADTLGLGLNSTAKSKQVTISDRNTYTKQTIYNGTLQGDHQLADKLKFNWSGVYSIAKREQPDRTDFSFDQNTVVNTSGLITSRDSNNVKLTHHWESNSDKDLAGYGNFTYSPKIANRVVEFSVGGLYRHKTRSAYYIDYSLGTTGNPFYHGDVNSLPFVFLSQNQATGAYNTASTNNYTATENINSEYLQVKFNLLDKLQLLGGVRVENTFQTYDTGEPITFSQRNGTISYTDVLPSIHLKYQLSDDQNLRASYFASISRPGFGEIVPYKIDGEYYNEVGNPDLKHITANNYDVRYEWFPGGSDQVLLGAFYKDISNPIEYFLVRDGASPSSQDIKPENAASGAKNYGIEAQVTKYFGIFGVSGNYTFTHSRVTTNKLLYYNDPVNGLQQKLVDQTRPLQGQANHVGNLSLLFKSLDLGLDMQLAFVYTGERIAQVSPYYNLDYWQHAYSQLDFSFEKTIIKRLSFYGKVNNLTNAASKIYLKYPHANIDAKQQEFLGKQDITNQTLVQSDIYKISFLGGFRYKF